jgi:hypothetical protein
LITFESKSDGDKLISKLYILRSTDL